MRAIVCRQFGLPKDLAVEPYPDIAAPGEAQVAVELSAWGLNYVDVLMIAGGYQLKPELPFIPGMEAAGTVIEVGPGVSNYQIGDRVMTRHRPGAFAERVLVNESALVAIPEDMDFISAAGFYSAFNTAYHGLVQGGRLQSGEIALIHGAAGGMGHAAVQVAKQLGAVVIATAGSDAKLDIIRQLGADHTINYQNSDLRDEVKALTDNRGVDVVFDPVGGDIFDASMRCLNWGARIVIVGFTSGRRAVVKTNHLLIKGASAIGIRAGEFGRHQPLIAQENKRQLLAWVQQGKIKAHVSHTFPFIKYADAMQAIIDREVIGKVILTRD